MMAFRLWKQLKKRIRRGRNPIWTLSCIALWLFAGMLSIGLFGGAVLAERAGAERDYGQPSLSEFLSEREEPVSATLHRMFICGEETEALGKLQPQALIKLLGDHPEWSAMMERDGRSIRIVEQVADLSSHCKSHAYFGIDKQGYFSLYDGQPSEDKVMRTFFQLDVRFMESSLPQEKLEQLTRGIHVKDIDEYNSVLSTFSDFAKTADEVNGGKQAY
ncbi:BofC C-terminal domain-containing protein [Paenibacillus sp. HB172176]|uniref:BofC C-terminal domain-containing protein n=1 Tax=Paenibacillus sp. HB172176 TaxID=2493690 RepID=UPI00143CB52E|nr:BofC C-terminal domain-containing protein [Paenibacillus sp. HB172176]